MCVHIIMLRNFIYMFLMRTLLRLGAFLEREKCPYLMQGNHWLCTLSLPSQNLRTGSCLLNSVVRGKIIFFL